jgi:uncharacterized protein with PIN domain
LVGIVREESEVSHYRAQMKNPPMNSSGQIRFACDAMLGGLARWLRTAGYDACWKSGVDDRELIQFSRDEGRTLLSADTQIFQFAVIRDGVQPALFVPLRLSPLEQLAFVLERLHLTLCNPRCMASGGELVEVPKERLRDRVPPRTFAWLERFWECSRCRQVFWHGTHWQRIVEALRQATAG